MTQQYSTADRTNKAAQLNTDIGINAQIQFYTGAMPANVGIAPSGTLLVQYAGNATAFGAAAAGVLTANAVANAVASAGGVAGYYRINTSAGTAVVQGLLFQQVVIATNALTAANGNVLNFASTTGVAVGMSITGTGVPTGATVVAFTGTTVTMSNTSTAGVANAASITFGGDITLTNTNIASGQTCTFTSYTNTQNGA
jgi:hypothetical protein